MSARKVLLLSACIVLATCAPKENPRFKRQPPSTVTYKDSFEKIKAAADNGDTYAMSLLYRHPGFEKYDGDHKLTQLESNVYLFKAAEMADTSAQIKIMQNYEQKVSSFHSNPKEPPPKIRWLDGFKRDYAKALYWKQRMACDGAGYFSSHDLAALYGGLDARDITPEERALVKPNLVLAYVHASMVPIKMFGRRIEQEELEKRMTDDQIDLAEDIQQLFYRGHVCPYVFKNEKLIGLQLPPDIADRYAALK